MEPSLQSTIGGSSEKRGDFTLFAIRFHVDHFLGLAPTGMPRNLKWGLPILHAKNHDDAFTSNCIVFNPIMLLFLKFTLRPDTGSKHLKFSFPAQKVIFPSITNDKILPLNSHRFYADSKPRVWLKTFRNTYTKHYIKTWCSLVRERERVIHTSV